MRSPLAVLIFLSLMLMLDSYFFQAIKTVSQNLSPKTRSVIYAVYWGVAIILRFGISFICNDR